MGDWVTVGLDDPGRRSPPVLRGVTPELAGIELIDAVMGRDHPLYRPALEYAGLLDPAAPPRRWSEVSGVRPSEWRSLLDQVRTVGAAALPAPEAWPALSLRSDDPATDARTRRIASLFALPARVAQPKRPHWWSRGARHAASVGTRTLAAAGPLSDEELAAALCRSAMYRLEPPSAQVRAAALLVGGAVRVPLDGRWAFDGPSDPKDAALISLARASGRTEHTFSEVVTLLIRAGWSAGAVAASISRQPLVDRVGPNAYRVLGAESQGRRHVP